MATSSTKKKDEKAQEQQQHPEDRREREEYERAVIEEARKALDGATKQGNAAAIEVARSALDGLRRQFGRTEDEEDDLDPGTETPEETPEEKQAREDREKVLEAKVAKVVGNDPHIRSLAPKDADLITPLEKMTSQQRLAYCQHQIRRHAEASVPPAIFNYRLGRALRIEQGANPKGFPAFLETLDLRESTAKRLIKDAITYGEDESAVPKQVIMEVFRRTTPKPGGIPRKKKDSLDQALTAATSLPGLLEVISEDSKLLQEVDRIKSFISAMRLLEAKFDGMADDLQVIAEKMAEKTKGLKEEIRQEVEAEKGKRK